MSSAKKGGKKIVKVKSAAPSAPKVDVPLPSNLDELTNVLMMGLSDNNDLVTKGTQIMDVYLKKLDSVVPLLMLITQNPDIQIRQMAAVLLRRSIGVHWKKIDKSIQHDIKNTLLQRLEAESNRGVMRSIAALVAAVAKHTVPQRQWDNLIEFLLSWCRAQEETKREIAMVLFRALAESIGSSLKEHYRTLQNIFATGLADPSPSVSLEALQAIAVLVEIVDNETNMRAFKELIPPIVELARRHVLTANDDALAIVFEVLDTLSQAPIPVLDNHVPALISMMIEVVENNNIEDNIRQESSGFIASLIEKKPKAVVKAGLPGPLLKAAVKLICEADDNAYDADEFTPQKMGVEILDHCLLNIPRAVIFNQTLTGAAQLCSSTNKHERKGGLVMLAVMAEGCGDNLIGSLPELVPVVCKYMNDPEHLVRTAACVALTQFADQIQPDIGLYHKTIVPHVLSVLDNPAETNQVKNKGVSVIEVLSECLSASDMKLYAEEVLKRVVVPLTTEAETDDDVQYHISCLSCIKAVAEALEADFKKYYADCIKVCARFMTFEDDLHLRLRCSATEAMGVIFFSVCKDEEFKKSVAKEMLDAFGVVIRGFKLNYFELRDSSYRFFLNLAEALGSDFLPLAPTVIPLLLSTLGSFDGVDFVRSSTAFDDGSANELTDSEEELEEDLEADYSRTHVSIRSGALDEKVSAMCCLSQVIFALGANFELYLDKTMVEVSNYSGYPHSWLRSANIHLMTELFRMFQKGWPSQSEPKKGELVPIHPHVASKVDELITLLLETLREEDHKDVAAVACDSIAEALKLFGMAAVHKYYSELNKLIILFLKEKAPSQKPEDDDDGSITADHDHVLIDSVTDLIGMMAKAYGVHMDDKFHDMVPLLIKFMNPNRTSSDRSMAIGCFAEVAEEFGTGIQRYLHQLLPLTLNAINDNSVVVRRNGVFCFGVLAQLSGSENVIRSIPSVYPSILKLFVPEVAQAAQVALAANNSSEPNYLSDADFIGCRDNAVSTLFKCVFAAPSAINLNEALENILASLPLTNDMQEATYVYTALIESFSNDITKEFMTKNVERVVKVFANVFGNPEVDGGVQKKMADFTKFLSSQMPPANFETLVNTLNEEEKERFVKFWRS